MKKKAGQVDWNAFSENVEKVLGEDFWSDMQHVIPRRGPSYDFYETEKEGVLIVDLPGFTTNDHIHLAQEGANLILKGEITYPYSTPEEELIHSERLKGKFKRIVPIPFPFTYDKVTATYQNGTLLVRVDKDTSEKEIVIRVGHQ